MTKNLIIGLLAVISVASIAFSYYQIQESQTNQLRALEFERLYNEMKGTAEEQKQAAENERKAAEYQMTRNQECEKKLAELKASRK